MGKSVIMPTLFSCISLLLACHLVVFSEVGARELGLGMLVPQPVRVVGMSLLNLFVPKVRET